MNLRAPDWPRCQRCTKLAHPDHRVVHEGKVFCCPDCVVLPDGSCSQALLRAQVLARDHGVCVLCTLDVAKLEAQVLELHANRRPGEPGAEEREKTWADFVRMLDHSGFDSAKVEKLESLWQADHIEARVYGGPSTLSNARTLCLPCHRSVTAELARDRAAFRRPARRGR